MPPITDLIRAAVQTLEATSPTARLDAELLLAHALNWSRARIIAERQHCPTPEQIAAFEELVARRANREPVAYLLGTKAFYGLDLAVTPDVLVPRPETELLVELSLALAQTRPTLSLVDLGTGSGAIITALGVHLPHATLYATDLSPAALAVAQHNLERHGLLGRVTLLQGDLLQPLPGPVDVIVSNPPYTILTEVEPGVFQHEPHLALDGGGADGAALYRRMIPMLPAALKPGGSVLLEIGAWQGALVAALLRQALPEAEVRLHQDLAGHNRVVTAQLPR